MSARPVPRLVDPDPLTSPTDEHPRWRLRVFDLCWPWRATRREAFGDAVASRNAHFDREDSTTYLDAAAMIQRDPPHHLDRLRREQRRCEAVRLSADGSLGRG